MDKKNMPPLFVFIVIGYIIAAFVLALLGRAAELTAFLVAGAIGIAFLKLESFSEIKGGGFYAKLRDKVDQLQRDIEPIKAKETEPDSCDNDNKTFGFTFEGYGTNEESRKVIKALLNPKYTWRYLGGISKDAGLSKEVSLKTLNWLLENKLGTFTEGEHGRLWSLTSKGRNVFNNIIIS